MKLTITINMDNAAFEDAGEVARILEDYAATHKFSRLEPGDVTRLRDINGNTVGEARLTRTRSR